MKVIRIIFLLLVGITLLKYAATQSVKIYKTKYHTYKKEDYGEIISFPLNKQYQLNIPEKYILKPRKWEGNAVCLSYDRNNISPATIDYWPVLVALLDGDSVDRACISLDTVSKGANDIFRENISYLNSFQSIEPQESARYRLPAALKSSHSRSYIDFAAIGLRSYYVTDLSPPLIWPALTAEGLTLKWSYSDLRAPLEGERPVYVQCHDFERGSKVLSQSCAMVITAKIDERYVISLVNMHSYDLSLWLETYEGHVRLLSSFIVKH